MRSKTGRGTIRNDLGLTSAVASNLNFYHIAPLLRTALSNRFGNTAPPWPTVSSLQQIPCLHNTGGLSNSSEWRQDVDRDLVAASEAAFIKRVGGICLSLKRVACGTK